MAQGGWRAGTNAEWDVERALFPARVVAFLEATQPKLWAEMRALHGDALDDLRREGAGEGAGPQGHAPRAAARLQVLRQDLPDGLVPARARAERGGPGALRAERS